MCVRISTLLLVFLFNKCYMLIVEHKENIEKIKEQKISLVHLVKYIFPILFLLIFKHFFKNVISRYRQFDFQPFNILYFGMDFNLHGSSKESTVYLPHRPFSKLPLVLATYLTMCIC